MKPPGVSPKLLSGYPMLRQRFSLWASVCSSNTVAGGKKEFTTKTTKGSFQDKSTAPFQQASLNKIICWLPKPKVAIK
jgi:hypothetical protein